MYNGVIALPQYFNFYHVHVGLVANLTITW